jgi:hypothetical protein
MPAETIKREFSRSGPVLQLLLRYTQALITQMSQTARGVQPPSLPAPATVPMAALELGSSAGQ